MSSTLSQTGLRESKILKIGVRVIIVWCIFMSGYNTGSHITERQCLKITGQILSIYQQYIEQLEANQIPQSEEKAT